MLKPIALSRAHAETSSVAESLPVLTDLLGFERVPDGGSPMLLRHPASEWELVLNERVGAPPKAHHDHYGVRVATNDEIRAAYAYLAAHQDEYGLTELLAPEYSHGALSVYFREPGGNVWEIECFEDVLRNPEKGGGTRLGGVRAPHWTDAPDSQPINSRGYIPRAFTHGTLACADEEVSGRFYADVLGLEVIRAYKHVVYIKHPDSKHYVVCLARPVGLNPFSANFRYTLTLDSPASVEAAHAELTAQASNLSIQEVGAVETGAGPASFLLRDLDGNYWEVNS
ncbi:MAG TPA: VOC family protein [Chloroflexota bacterium]|jgi:catechol 2,3-dioxygenase-like lactoylglutathione lyase family enzyme